MTPQDYLKAKLQLIQFEKEKKALQGIKKEYELNNKIEFWKPWPHQQRLLDYLHLGKKIILDQGANRTGKTAFGVNVVGSAALGYQPWDKQPTTWGKQPLKIRVICADWEHHAKEVIVPALKEWLPKNSYTTKKNNVGVEVFWTFPETGTTIELLTYIQDTKTQEGWKGHLIWADEPLPRDKYIANLRGLLDYDGVFLMTMTAVYESWILDDIVLKNDPTVGVVADIPMTANPLLSEEAIRKFSNACNEEERQARVFGGWLQLSGIILSKFNKDIHVITPSKVPPDWPVVAMIDFHPAIQQAIGFYAWDKYNREFVIDEIWEHGSPEEISNEIARRKQKNQWNLKKAYIDPLSKGDVAGLKQRNIHIEDSYTVFEKTLRPYGITLHVASKDIRSGISNLNSAFKGPNNIPTFFIYRTCERHIWEYQRWIYDPKTKKPKDGQCDHFCENSYRSTLTGTHYIPPEIYTKPLHFQDSGVV